MSPILMSSVRQHFHPRWILNTWLDIAFFVATPLLIIPVVFTAGAKWQAEDVFLIVSTFGALGHHAPGLMRAYGDRQLFRRFWLRFTLVPIIAVGVFTYYSVEELPGLMLVLLSWGIWHFLMQTYGFARIYDSKVRCFDVTTRRLDFAVCVAWFGTCVLSAPNRMSEFLSLALKSGLSFVVEFPLEEFRLLWMGATAIVTVLFIGNVVKKTLRGEAVNSAKLILLVSTFLFFWMCTVTLTSFVIGIAMFELFHDVQYLAIVWLFNRNRVEKEADVGPFTRFVFRRSGGMVGLYLGLVVAYGFIGFAAERLTSATLQQTLFGIVAASNLLHFYYDGFIWKIRERETSRALGVDNTTSAPVALPRWFSHASKWALLLIVVGLLAVAERSSQMSDLSRVQAIAEWVPKSVTAQNHLAKSLIDEGRYVDAIRVCRTAEKLNPSEYRSHMYLGVALTAIGQPNAGFAELQRALELNSHNAYLHFHLAMGFVRRNQPEEALVHLGTSVDIRPDDPVGQYNLGVLHLRLNQTDEAIASLHEATQLDPEYAAAWRSLGEAYLMRHDEDVAIEHLNRSFQLKPDVSETHLFMSQALRQLGNVEAADDALTTAVQLQLKISIGGQRAITAAHMADQLLEHTNRRDPDALGLAARCYIVADRIGDAVQTASLGASLARKNGDTELAESLERMAERYNNESDNHGSR